MTELGPAAPAPTKEELISKLSKPIGKVITMEMSDENDIDRVWILRKIHKAYLYYRDLAYFAPALYQGLVDATGIDGTLVPDLSGGQGIYDYTQNIYRGYCRKLEAVLGTRIPNAIAIPNDPSSDKDQAASRAANDAAMYMRQKCEFQTLVLWLIFSLFNFGTSFWNREWCEDGDKNGWKEVPQEGVEPVDLGGQDGVPSFQADAPAQLPPTWVPKGALEIDILSAAEVSVPLEADGRKGISDCRRVRREREVHKSRLLRKYNGQNGSVDLRALLKDVQGAEDSTLEDQSASGLYGQSVRSAMASPIGIVRPKSENFWTVIEEDWMPEEYEMIDSDDLRQMCYDNFPDGLRITAAKGRVVDLEPRKLVDHWQECQPEPTVKIMCDPLGDDWIVTQDLENNLLNQQNEAVERSNDPGFADPTRVDLDAWQRRRDRPGDLIPALRPAGGTLGDIIFRPPPLEFSAQIPVFKEQVEQTSKTNSGLLDEIWGGGGDDPTARQTELKTNAAIRQLGVTWIQVGKSLEQVYAKGCKILSEHEDGIIAFSKKNQFGKFDSVAVSMEDLRGGEFHFEADEAIPMTWGQQRDLLMWLLDKPKEVLDAYGLNDPLNVFEQKQLLGIPGMRTPHLDDRDKGMNVIGQLLQESPAPGPVDPATGQPGPPAPSIAPDWEDDSAFMAELARAYLTVNFRLKEANPDGYQNVILWGTAHEQKANQPAAPEPPKTSVTLAFKGEDIGPDASTAALQKAGIEPPGVQAVQTPMPKLLDPNTLAKIPPPGAPPGAPGPQGSPPPGPPSVQ